MTRYRIAAHVHSDWSYDGRWRLEDLVKAFSRRRYDAVLMAEHDVGFDQDRWNAYRGACASAGAGRLLLVPGIEYSDRDNRVHVLVWGDIPFLGEGRQTAELLELAVSHGAAAFLAHPARHSVGGDVKPEWVEHLTGIEVWNRKYDGVAPSSQALALARSHPSLAAISGLDFHTRRQFFPLWLELSVNGGLDLSSVFAGLAGAEFTRRCLGIRSETLEARPWLAAPEVAEFARRRVARVLRARRRR